MCRSALLACVVAVTTSSVAACVPSATGKGLMAGGAADASTSGDSRSRTQITAAEMSQVTASTLYEVIQRLHPEWLSSRGTTRVANLGTRSGQPENGIRVYLDTQQAGTVDLLRQLPIGSAALIRYYSAPDAQTRFGLGNMGAVIQILETVPSSP